MEIYKKIVSKTIFVTGVVVGLLVVILTAFQFAEVICRYLLGSSLIFVEELSRVLLIWLGFLGAAIALYTKAHVGIDMVVNKFSKPVQHAVGIIVLLVIILDCGIILYGGIRILPAQMTQTMPTLSIPKFWAYLSIPVSMIVFLIQLLYSLLCSIRKQPEDLTPIDVLFSFKKKEPSK